MLSVALFCVTVHASNKGQGVSHLWMWRHVIRKCVSQASGVKSSTSHIYSSNHWRVFLTKLFMSEFVTGNVKQSFLLLSASHCFHPSPWWAKMKMFHHGQLLSVVPFHAKALSAPRLRQNNPSKCSIMANFYPLYPSTQKRSQLPDWGKITRQNVPSWPTFIRCTLPRKSTLSSQTEAK